MKPRAVACVLSLLFAIALPQAALAKGPTVKLTITGPGLPHAITVIDPQILESSNVWGGQFLDSSRMPLNEAPHGLRRYEIAFYVTLPRDTTVRKKYVVYYYPDASGKQGYIYLPGRGEQYYWLNVGSILRKGQDGKWNYAAPAWEALIKPVITRAQAAQARAAR